MTSFVQQSTLAEQSVWYPSLVVNLQLRLDEGLELIGTPKAPSDLAGGDTLPSRAGTKLEPVVTEQGGDNLSKVIGIVPKSCTVELPAYRQAGTFEFEIEFRDLPLDPRVIRAMGVAIHLDAVPATDFADGMTQAPPFGAQIDRQQRRASIIETSPANIVLAGLADDITTAHDSSGALVRVSGRDLRGILLDTPISPKTLTSIDLRKPIDQVVANIVENLHPAGLGIDVQVNADEWPAGTVPSPATLDDVTRVNLDALGNSIKPTAKGEVQKVNFWDLITQYCFNVGGVPHFVGSKLRIRPARSLFDRQRQDKAFDPALGQTPFSGGVPRDVRQPFVQTPEQWSYRRMVFGRDLESLHFERKLGGVKVPVVQVSSYDTGGAERGLDRLIQVQWPEPAKKQARATSTGASGKTLQTGVIPVTVHGIKNKDRLLEIAKNLYEEIGRQEVGGSAETKNLASFGGGNNDPDLLKLRPGDPVEFRVDGSGLGVFPPPISELTQVAGRSFEEQVRAVTERIGDENLARILVATSRGEVAGLQKVFRTATVRYTWSTTGVAIAFDFQNFVEARYDVEEELPLPELEPLPLPLPELEAIPT